MSAEQINVSGPIDCCCLVTIIGTIIRLLALVELVELEEIIVESSFFSWKLNCEVYDFVRLESLKIHLIGYFIPF